MSKGDTGFAFMLVVIIVQVHFSLLSIFVVQGFCS